MKNFKNPALTIHQRQQKLVASYQLDIQVDQINFFEESNRNRSPLIAQVPNECIQIAISQHPFSTKKRILRKLKVRNDLYFKATSFYKRENEMFVTGQVLRKKQESNNVRTSRFVKFGNLFQLEQCFPDEKCIKLNDLHFANDFLYFNNNLMYLLEWIQ